MKYLKHIALTMLISLLLFTSCLDDVDKNELNESKEKNVSSAGDDSKDDTASSSESSSDESSPQDEENSSENDSSSEESSSEDDAQNTFKTQENTTSSDSGIIYEDDTAYVPNTAPVDVDISTLNREQITWGPGSTLGSDGRPDAPVQLQEKYGHLGAYFIGSQTKKIYLTFDQGYENGFTTPILDTLKEKNVSAVFFVTMDYATKNHDLIRRMIDEGHIVANHSNHHPNMTTISDDKCVDEIMSLHSYIKENFAYDMWLFRPPEGAFSEHTLGVAQSQGYQSVFWSFAYKDWEVDNQPERAAALDRMTSFLHDGAIYLLHAVSETNAEVLDEFIDDAQTKGYNFSRYDLGN